jgi:hypothetical protein
VTNRSRRVGLQCQWHKVAVNDSAWCDDLAEVTGAMLCRKHLRYVARLAGYVPKHEAEPKLRAEYESKLQGRADLIANLQNHIRTLQSEPDRRPAPTDGTVYYLRVGSYIKIGWASDLTKRMKAYPPDSVLLATEPGTRKDEARRHRMFAAHRTHGREWYAMVPSILHHVDTLTAQHGTPDPVSFAAKPVQIPRPYSARRTA